MSSVKSKVSYLKGLIDGLGIDHETNEGRVICEITNVLEEISKELDCMKNSHDDIKEYVEQIDNDLINVEDEIYGLSDELIDEDCEYNDDDFEEMKCPNCNEAIFIDKTLFGNNEKLECPNCRYGMVLCSDSSHEAE